MCAACRPRVPVYRCRHRLTVSCSPPLTPHSLLVSSLFVPLSMIVRVACGSPPPSCPSQALCSLCPQRRCGDVITAYTRRGRVVFRVVYIRECTVRGCTRAGPTGNLDAKLPTKMPTDQLTPPAAPAAHLGPERTAGQKTGEKTYQKTQKARARSVSGTRRN